MNKNSQKPLLTVGICALNEESNIGHLLNDIKAQKAPNFTLDTIYVVSDGSTDNTVTTAKSSGLKNLHVLEFNSRQGVANRQNLLLKKATSDVVVLLNADIRIPDQLFLSRLAAPIINKQAELTSCNLVPIPAKSFVEKVLITSSQLKTRLFENFNNGLNIYTCHGTARAFSKQLYSRLRFIHSVGEDAYSYLYAQANNFKYQYVKNTFVYYKEPSNLKDYLKQSRRYQQSKSQFTKEFDAQMVKNTYDLPFLYMLKTTVQIVVSSPADVALYVLLLILRKASSFHHKPVSNTWEIAKSSKQLSL